MQKTTFPSITFLKSVIAFGMLIFFFDTADAQVKPSKVAKQTWYQAKTRHFNLITDVNEKHSLSIMQSLEKFRSMVNLFNGGEITNDSRPIKVIVTKRKKMYVELSSNSKNLKRTVGFFKDTINGNYAILRFQGRFDFSTLFHEYTHYLMADLINDNLPYWYNEGLAEYMGNVEIKGEDQIFFGKPVRHHLVSISRMKWVKMEDILTARYVNYQDKKRRYQTYSQGWLAVHYFNSSAAKNTQLREYLRLTRDGVSEAQALRKAMDMSFADLDRVLKSYAKKGRFLYSKITLNNPLQQSDIELRKLSAAQLTFELGEYFLQGSVDFGRAKIYFDEAIKHDEKHVGSLAGLANLALFDCAESPCNKAESLIKKARELNPNHVFAATISGHINAFKMSVSKSESELNEYWNRAVRDYNVAINSGEINVEAMAAAGSLYATKGRWETALELYETAYSYAPSNYSTRAYMIQAHLANGNLGDAETMANKVRNNNHFADEGIASFEEWYEKVKELHSSEY